jgi:hypothetical protein
MESTNVSHRTNDIANLGHLAGAKRGERNELTHGNQPISVENDSQYYLSADSNELQEAIQLAEGKKLVPTGKMCGVAGVPGGPIRGNCHSSMKILCVTSSGSIVVERSKVAHSSIRALACEA